MTHSQTLSVDGQTLKREEANLLLIELNRLPERSGLAARDAATVIKRALLESSDVPLSEPQAAAVRRAIEGLRIKRRNLPAGLLALRSRLARPACDRTESARVAPDQWEASTYRRNVA
jgi:hypothetical protein